MFIPRWRSGSAAILALGTLAGAGTPLVVSAPVSAQQANFSDVSRSYWARPFIQTLASEGVISGFPDGTYKPDKPVTRAEFAAIVRQAFDEGTVKSARSFSDVPANYWAAAAIDKANTTGFMSGYPEGTFQPNQPIPKVQVLVSLASGLKLAPDGSTSNALGVYSDAGQIPSYATSGVAAATQRKIVVNYPNVKFLNPNDTATRADVAAFIYQALVAQKEIQPLAKDSPAAEYIVGGTSGAASDTTTGSNTSDDDSASATGDSNLRVAQNTTIAVKYPESKTIAITRDETRPITLQVAKDVKNSKGNQVLIPQDSQIVGQLVPRYDTARKFLGVQFVAQRLRIGNQTYPVTNWSSGIVTSQPVNAETVKGTDASQAVQNIIGAIIGGQGTTAQKQEQAQDEIIVVNPSQLQLTVGSDFYVKSGS